MRSHDASDHRRDITILGRDPARADDHVMEGPVTARSAQRGRSLMPVVGLAAVLAIVAVAVVVFSGDPATQTAPEPESPLAVTDGPEPTSDQTDSVTDGGELGLVAALSDAGVDEHLVIVSGPSTISALATSTGATAVWNPPEELAAEDPLPIADGVVIVGVTRAWWRPVSLDGSSGLWLDLGPADRVRPSTKPDRLWLRVVYDKIHPTDAEFHWREVDLEGTTHRTMFRDRPLYLPTPELVSGLGGDIFRLTDLDINPWRLMSPYGIIIATGVNDLIAKECNRRLVCRRVWYDTASGQPRDSVFGDLAQVLEISYGAELSDDGRFVVEQNADGLLDLRLVANRLLTPTGCAWDAPWAWTSASELLACTTSQGLELFTTDPLRSLGTVGVKSDFAASRITFSPARAARD